jgi:hypothetical protein
MQKGPWMAVSRLALRTPWDIPLRTMRLIALAEIRHDPSSAEELHSDVVLVGSAPFVHCCSLALALLRVRDPVNHRRVCQLLREIVEYRFSGATYAFSPGRTGYLLVDPRCAGTDTRLLSSVFAHEAAHAKLAKRYHRCCLRPSAESEEQLCLHVQLRCLRRLGWTADEVSEYGQMLLGSRWWTINAKLRRSCR